MIKKIIKIKCKLCDSLDFCHCKIKIYDKKNHLIIDDFTDKSGNYLFLVPCYGIYKISIINCNFFPSKKNITVFIDETYSEELCVIFNKFVTRKKHLVTINVLDYNYKGLPLNKGRVILWKKVNK